MHLRHHRVLPGRRFLIISFVIPVYRNERAVTITYDKIVAMCQKDLPAYEREFVFVDDGSDDGSLAELLAIRERDASVRIVSFTRNFGQMAAILAGLKTATGDLVAASVGRSAGSGGAHPPAGGAVRGRKRSGGGLPRESGGSARRRG